jgi:hypothetical protein
MEQIKFFCFRCDTKETKSKRFAFVPIIRGPNQDVLLWSLSFWIIYKRSTLPEITSRPNQIALFRPRIFEPNRNDLLARKHFFYQIKMFCFCSDNSEPNQNLSCFELIAFRLNRNVLLCLRQFPDQIKLLCFVPEFLGQNGKDLFAIKKFWTKSKCFAFVPIVRGPNQNVLLSFR